jgi:hypothetical protein
MRVVLIAYHFPPDPAVGSLRAAKVARAFVGAGHRVDVVTARLPADSGPPVTGDPALTVHPVDLMASPRDLSAWINARLSSVRRRQAGGAVGVQPATWTPPTRVSGWRRLLSSLLWLPDDRQGFIVPAWRKARSLVRAGARLVYSTAPPYSPHLVGRALKSIRDVRWVMELRDPWADNDQKPWWVRTRVTDALDARLERSCLRHADLVVTASEGIRRRLLERLPALDETQIFLARNGIEHLASSVPWERRPGPIRIAYAGTFYYSRDPRPFLRGLAGVCRKLRMGPDQVRVDFIGACRTVGAVSVEQEIETLGLTGVVHIQDWLSHAAAKTVVEEADVLLLLAQRQPDQVPNKLYEYLGTRRPIVAFADADGETARMLRRAGGHQVVTGEDETDVERALDEVLGSVLRGEGGTADETVLKEWTTEVQMQRLLAAVGG